MPILIRSVRAPTAAAMLSGADNTERCGSKCSSASHIVSRPQRSAASICSNASAKASRSVRPGRAGNWWNMPNSMAPFSLLGSQGEQWTQDSAPGRSVAIIAKLQVVIPVKSGNPGTLAETVAPVRAGDGHGAPTFAGVTIVVAVSDLWSREVRAEFLAPDLGRVGVDQNEGEDGRRRAVIDPGVHRAAL